MRGNGGRGGGAPGEILYYATREGVTVKELRELHVDLRRTLHGALIVVGETQGLQQFRLFVRHIL